MSVLSNYSFKRIRNERVFPMMKVVEFILFLIMADGIPVAQRILTHVAEKFRP